jgi:hypothetical protein
VNASIFGVIFAAVFGLAIAAFECAASGHDTAAAACVYAFVSMTLGLVAWMIWIAVRS